MAKKKSQPKPVPSWMKYSWWIVPLLAVLVYIPSFTGQFTLDDKLIVENNDLIKAFDKIPAIWTSHYWAGKIDASDTSLYRPLTLTSYALQYIIHKDNPVPYHIFNILLHALVCFALMKLVNLLFRDYQLTILSGVFFAIHPIHTEAVCGIVGRAELLAALFIVTSSISYHHWRDHGNGKWLGALLISTVAAITSKEHGFMLAPILGLQEAVYYFNTKKYQGDAKRIGVALGSVIAISVWLWVVRSSITGSSVPHEQWLGVDPSDRMATSLRTMADYLELHIWPIHLSADYWTDEVPILSFGHMPVILSSVLIFCLLVLALLQRRKMIPFSWGVFFFFLTLLPVSNFLFAVGFLKAERILYIPSIGIIVAMAALLARLYKTSWGKWAAYVLAGAFLLFFLSRTWLRTEDWKNNYTLALATLKISPNSPRFNNMMGLELRHLNRNDEALLYFQKAVQSNPNHVPALVNLGMEYKNFNRLEEAAATLEKALKTDPSIYATYVNLMSVYRSLKDYDKNVATAEKALARYPESASVLWNAANAYQLKGDMARSNELRAKAREIEPNIGSQ